MFYYATLDCDEILELDDVDEQKNLPWILPLSLLQISTLLLLYLSSHLLKVQDVPYRGTIFIKYMVQVRPSFHDSSDMDATSFSTD